MKKVLVLVLLCGWFMACTTGNTGSKSIENQAKELTVEMTRMLSLSKTQEEKVLGINLVKMRLDGKVSENGEMTLQQIQEKYTKEMKQVLNENQFTVFSEKYLNRKI